VSVAGPADLRVMLGYSDDPKSPSRRYWTRFMGVTGPGDPRLAEISPVAHAKDVAIPILLIHGMDDTVVPFEQSQLMANALERAGKHVKLVRLDNEDHWLSRSDTRLQMLQATVDFLEKNNPPK
jgi:dipeptidyl aminopeptidase/acylaminoacyl peptidase